MFGNSKKDRNHEPSEDKAIINDSVGFIYHSFSELSPRDG
jgi:hypothetical protein